MCNLIYTLSHTQSTRDEREETVTGTGAGVGTGGNTEYGDEHRVGMGAGTGTKIEMTVEGREAWELAKC